MDSPPRTHPPCLTPTQCFDSLLDHRPGNRPICSATVVQLYSTTMHYCLIIWFHVVPAGEVQCIWMAFCVKHLFREDDLTMNPQTLRLIIVYGVGVGGPTPTLSARSKHSSAVNLGLCEDVECSPTADEHLLKLRQVSGKKTFSLWKRLPPFIRKALLLNFTKISGRSVFLKAKIPY